MSWRLSTVPNSWNKKFWDLGGYLGTTFGVRQGTDHVQVRSKDINFFFWLWRSSPVAVYWLSKAVHPGNPLQNWTFILTLWIHVLVKVLWSIPLVPRLLWNRECSSKHSIHAAELGLLHACVFTLSLLAVFSHCDSCLRVFPPRRFFLLLTTLAYWVIMKSVAFLYHPFFCLFPQGLVYHIF